MYIQVFRLSQVCEQLRLFAILSIFGFVNPFFLEGVEIKVFQPITLNEALMTTIDRQLEIKIAELNIPKQRGVIQESAGPFDPIVQDTFDAIHIANPNYLSSNLKSNLFASQYDNTLIVSRLTRCGTFLKAEVDTVKVNNFIAFLGGAIPNPRVSDATVLLRLEQAVLRGGLCQSLNYQKERAAKRELDAVKYTVLQTISEKVRETALAYWDFVAAIKALAIHKDAEDRFEFLRKKVQRQIDGKEAATSDILQVDAALAIKIRNRIAATFQLYLTMKQLLFAMGAIDEKISEDECDFDQIIDVLPAYPNVFFDTDSLFKITNQIVSYGLTHRFDILASQIQEEVAQLILKGLSNDTLPELNLFSEVKKNDFKTGGQARNLESALYWDRPEIDWKVGVTVSFPCFNDRAIGAYKQGLAELKQVTINTQFIKEQVIRDVLVTLQNQMALSSEIFEADKAVEYYKTVVANELEKLSAGFTTLFQVISYENFLSDSLLLQNNLYLEYSRNIVNLRYFSGSLIELSEGCRIIIEEVSSLPIVNPSKNAGGSL